MVAQQPTIGTRTVARRLGEEDPAFISALAKGLAILSLFTPERPKLTFSEICSQSELPRSSVNRFLGTLLGLDFIAFDEETRRYMTGPRAMSLGMAALEAMDVRELVHPHLMLLFRRLDETVSYGVRDASEVVIADRVATRRVIAVELSIGARLPLHSTSMGRCLIAFLPEDAREALLQDLSVRQALPAPERLRQAIERAHRDGYALSDEEFAPGLLSVAMPVWDRRKRIVGAANVGVPSFRTTPGELLNRIIPALMEAARNISLSLGASGEWIDGGWHEQIIGPHGDWASASRRSGGAVQKIL
jgi:IclR family transcriptional regulator, pca regulon regulatory protein